MKIRIETVHVPAETYEVKHLGCDHCDYETTEDDDLKRHHANTHAVKKEQTVNKEKFYWFESEEDARLWLGENEGIADYIDAVWTGPGWYGLESSSGTGRCRCGGCSWFGTSLHPLAMFIERWRKDITTNDGTTEARLQSIEAALKM
jgi:hypothetical protein